jgi:hypothetical protein
MVDVSTFAAAQVGFVPDAARSEAGRCFRCDVVDRCPSVTVLAGRGPGEDRPAAIVVMPSTPAAEFVGPASTGGLG